MSVRRPPRGVEAERQQKDRGEEAKKPAEVGHAPAIISKSRRRCGRLGCLAHGNVPPWRCLP